MSTQAAGLVPQFTVHDRLRKAREHAGMEQGELAELIGVSRNTVSNNEGGKVQPRRIVLRAWALATGVDLRWLETGEAPRPEGDPNEGLTGECASRDSNPEPADYETPQVARVLAFGSRERGGRPDGEDGREAA